MKSTPMRRLRFASALLIAMLLISQLSSATPMEEAEAIPHVNERARADYLDYRYADGHKAYAIAPGGAWSWRSGAASEEEAKTETLAACQKRTFQRCTLYAVNDRVVFDPKRWRNLWGPYLSKKEAALTRRGTSVGERFVDLIWYDDKGMSHSVDKLQGRVAMIHFWGSWCPPCMRELPLIKRFQQTVETRLNGKVAMIMLQVREPFSQAINWAKANELDDLPLFDSGMQSNDQDYLFLTGRRKLKDRELAKVFPTSYVIDSNGIILFKHNGAIDNWDEYLPFFKNAAIKSKMSCE